MYWFTGEIGLVKEKGQRKSYGGAVVSSMLESENAMSAKPTFEKFGV
jgi:phenylalanine-4-hydroxylase